MVQFGQVIINIWHHIIKKVFRVFHSFTQLLLLMAKQVICKTENKAAVQDCGTEGSLAFLYNSGFISIFIWTTKSKTLWGKVRWCLISNDKVSEKESVNLWLLRPELKIHTCLSDINSSWPHRLLCTRP